jgi:hypothetical protein
MSNKIEEARIRRIAKRRGFILHKSARRDKLAIDYDKYLLVDSFSDRIAFGDHPRPFAATLDEVSKFLNTATRRK